MNPSSYLMLARLCNSYLVIAVWICSISCMSCFPAVGEPFRSIGGLYLQQYESMLINKALPIVLWCLLAVLSFIHYLVAASWMKPTRFSVAVLGVIVLLAAFYFFWVAAYGNALHYLGLAMVTIVLVYDLVRPAVVIAR